MEISEELLCLFSAEVTNQDGTYVIEVPKREVSIGGVEADDTHRVALLPHRQASQGKDPTSEKRLDREPEKDSRADGPPVEEGETRTVEIESIGDQGDGIARVERGYVVIVPETEKGEKVIIEIVDVKDNVAFAQVVERVNYYE